MKRLIFIIPIAAIVLMCTSCIGLFNAGKKYPVTISGDIQEPVYIDGEEIVLPTKLSYHRTSTGWSTAYSNDLYNKDYKIKVFAENYRTETLKIKKRLRPVVFLDLINPLCIGPFGFWLDFVCGTAYAPKNKNYFITMEPINRSDREKLEFWQELQLEDKAIAHLEQWYNKALTDEERYEIGTNIGRSLLDLNYLPDKAMLYFQKAYNAAHMQPEEGFEYWAAIGNFLDERGDIKKAVPYFKKAYAIAKIPEKQQMLDWLEYGETYLNEGKTEQALLYFTEAQNIDASNSLVQQYILSATNLQLSQRLEKQEQERVKRELEEQQRLIQQQRKQAWADFAQTLNSTASTIATINNNKKGTNTASTPNRTSNQPQQNNNNDGIGVTSCSHQQQRYNNEAASVKHWMGSYKDRCVTYFKDKAAGKTGPLYNLNTTDVFKQIQQHQSNMRNCRKICSSIPQSELETITPKAYIKKTWGIDVP